MTTSTKIQATLDSYKDNPQIPQDLLARTRDLYVEVDSLDAPTRRLLVQNILSETKGALEVVATDPHDPIAVAGLVTYADSLIALAGYTGQTLRDEAQETSTGDSRAAAVIEHLRGLIADTAKAHLASAGLDTEGNPLDGTSKEAVLLKDDASYGVYL